MRTVLTLLNVFYRRQSACSIILKERNPVGICCQNDVVTTSMRRDDIAYFVHHVYARKTCLVVFELLSKEQ